MNWKTTFYRPAKKGTCEIGPIPEKMEITANTKKDAEKAFRFEASRNGWRYMSEWTEKVKNQLSFKCTGCGKVIADPSPAEAFLMRCDDCTAKEEEENP